MSGEVESQWFGSPAAFIFSSFPPSCCSASFLPVLFEFQKGLIINSSVIVFPTAPEVLVPTRFVYSSAYRSSRINKGLGRGLGEG